MPNYETTTDDETYETKETIKPDQNEESDIPDEDTQALIIAQVQAEYNLAWEFTQTKRTEGLRRLKLFNNQKRDPKKVGDPLLFSVFQTVLAKLYEDKLSVMFMGREEGDDDQAENLEALAINDHDAMEKDELDYEWDWDTCFFGRGLLQLSEFDREQMVPVGEVIDPMVFIRDPDATSVNGNQKGYGSLRFYGIECSLSKREMEEHEAYFNTSKIKKGKDLAGLKNEAKQARDDAQGRQVTSPKEEELGDNYGHNLIEWYTHWKGDKYLCTVANDRTLLVRFQKVKGTKWPLIDRTLFPMSHDWDGVSIPDLIEDKQRARSVMINLGMQSAKADLYPMYLFDRKKIKNPKDLDFEFNKMVPVNGDTNGAITPIQKSVFHQQVNLILNILDVAAQKAVAAPETAQGVRPGQQRTLGESELVAAGSDSRHSLAARIWGWSEKRFWKQWYFLYETYFQEGIDEKSARIQGPLAAVFRKIKRKDIILNTHPDIIIESASIAKAKREEQFRQFSSYLQIVGQHTGTNLRYADRKLGKIMGMKKAELTLLIPPTIDELKAEDENHQLDDNKFVEVNPMDDDIIHLEIHNKAEDTPAKLSHMEAHKYMMLYKKEHPEMFPAPQSPIIPGSTPINTQPAEPSTSRVLPVQQAVAMGGE